MDWFAYISIGFGAAGFVAEIVSMKTQPYSPTLAISESAVIVLGPALAACGALYLLP